MPPAYALSRGEDGSPTGTDEDCHEDVAALLDATTDGTPEPSAAHALARYTGGDAFFVTELLRSGGGLEGPGSEAPTTAVSVRIRDAVRARTAELSPRTALLLDLAALLGTRFRLDVLADAAAVPLDEVRALLGEAAGAGLLAEAGAGEGRFRHGLLREALSGRPEPAERTGLHRALTGVLVDHARRGRETGPAEVAHHCGHDAGQPGRRSLDMYGDDPCALHRLGMRGVHLQVIGHALVDHIRLGRGHPGDPIASCDLTACGNRTVTPDADPQHPQFAQSLLPSLL